jgi:hypothetical protein
MYLAIAYKLVQGPGFPACIPHYVKWFLTPWGMVWKCVPLRDENHVLLVLVV